MAHRLLEAATPETRHPMQLPDPEQLEKLFVEPAAKGVLRRGPEEQMVLEKASKAERAASAARSAGSSLGSTPAAQRQVGNCSAGDFWIDKSTSPTCMRTESAMARESQANVWSMQNSQMVDKQQDRNSKAMQPKSGARAQADKKMMSSKSITTMH